MLVPIYNFKTGAEVESFESPEFMSALASKGSAAVLSYMYKVKKVYHKKTASTKTISDVSGTTKKPYNQKGTGNARQGSLRSPQYRGGGIIFGPVPITAKYKINKSEKLYVKKVLFAKLLKLEKVKIVESIDIPAFSTKESFSILSTFANSTSVCLIHDHDISHESLISLRNIRSMTSMSVENIVIESLVKHEVIVCTKQAFAKLIDILS